MSFNGFFDSHFWANFCDCDFQTSVTCKHGSSRCFILSKFIELCLLIDSFSTFLKNFKSVISFSIKSFERLKFNQFCKKTF